MLYYVLQRLKARKFGGYKFYDQNWKSADEIIKKSTECELSVKCGFRSVRMIPGECYRNFKGSGS